MTYIVKFHAVTGHSAKHSFLIYFQSLHFLEVVLVCRVICPHWHTHFRTNIPQKLHEKSANHVRAKTTNETVRPRLDTGF